MNMRSKLVAITGSALILASSITMGAAQSDEGAATVGITSDTNVNVISVLISDGEFGDHAYSLANQDVTGDMTVTVDDMRGTAAGWSVKLKATDFIPDATERPVNPNAVAIPVGNLSLLPSGDPVPTNSAQTAANIQGQNTANIDPVLVTDTTFWTAENGHGAGTFDLDLDGNLMIPGGTLVGDYKSTVTVTLDAAP